jgi:hypothetical protein
MELSLAAVVLGWFATEPAGVEGAGVETVETMVNATDEC